jgi:membrane protease YdiL (CAAX protease family)
MNTMGTQATVLSPSPARNNHPATPHASRGGRLREWTARHPVSAFLVLAFSLAYPAMSLPLLADHGVIPGGWMPQRAGLDTERIASLLLVFGALLPAALLVTWAAEGRPGIQALVTRMLRWRIGPRWWLLILAGLPALTLAFAVLLGDTLEPVDIAPFVIGQVFGLVVNLLLINLWEETAWTGVVQTRLERRHGLATAALLTAVPFALAHMPLHFIGDFTVESLATALVALLIVCAIVRLMIGVFLRGTRDSILAVALLHTVFNRSNNEEGLVARLVEGDARKLGGLLAVLVLTAVVALVARRKLGRSYRLRLDSAAATSATTSAGTDRDQG